MLAPYKIFDFCLERMRTYEFIKMPSTKSKKFSIFVAILILFAGVLIGGFLFIKTRAGSANISDQFNYLLGKEKNVAAEDKNIDSDNDGLPDWQETIYKTDPRKPDTDGDGYLDGEEVATGYDPLKKAPNDIVVSANSQKPRPLPQNLTKALSFKLSQSIVNGKIKSFNKTTGQPLTQEELEQEAGLSQAMEEAIGQQIDEFIIPDISDTQIKISSQTGRAEALSYLNEMGSAIGRIPNKDEPEMQLFIDAMESGNFSKLEEIRKIYEQSYKNLKEVAVPSDLVDFHKGILGVLWVTNNIYAAIKNISQDPLKTTIAISQYRKIDERTNNLIAQLLERIKKYQ